MRFAALTIASSVKRRDVGDADIEPRGADFGGQQRVHIRPLVAIAITPTRLALPPRRSTVLFTPMSSKCSSRKRRAARLPFDAQHFEEIVVGRASLAASNCVPWRSSTMRCTLMRRYWPRPDAARQPALIDQARDEFDGAIFGEQRRVEGDFVDAVHDLAGRRRRRLPHQRIDLHDQHVLGLGGAEERKDHRVAEIAAVPVGHAVDLDRTKQAPAGRPTPSPHRR